MATDDKQFDTVKGTVFDPMTGLDEKYVRLKDMTCPQCGRGFRLTWNDYRAGEQQRVTLQIRGCPSGGIYDVSIACPHCDYEEPL